MPVYEYDCMSCAIRYSKQRSIKDEDPGYFCDKCNKNLVRVYSNTEVIFNGTGFYKTDNRTR